MNRVKRLRTTAKILLMPFLGLFFVSPLLFLSIASYANIAFISSFGFLITAIFLMIIANRSLSNKEDFLFFRCYDLYIKLQTCVDAKTKHANKKSRDSMGEISYYVGLWASNAPSVISRIPNPISKKLDEKLLPLVKENKFQEISSFANSVFNITLTLYVSGEPDLEILSSWLL